MGETPFDCLKRELREEACAEIDRAVVTGFVLVDHSANVAYAGVYPLRSALAIYSVILSEFLIYVPSEDALSRCLVEVDALPRLHHQWDPVLDAAYRDARDQLSILVGD